MGCNPLLWVFNCLRIAWILIRKRPRIIVSTGAEIAVPVFFLGKLLDLLSHYGIADETTLILTADHGQMWVDPKKTLYLNQTPQFPQIRRLLRENRRGEVLAPGGSPRDMFLYVKEPLLGEAKALVAAAVQGRADVYSIDELIAEGLFGPEPPSPTFLSRVGNLVILPRKHETVWWYEKDRFEQKFYGHHGGLSPEEMEIPMLTYHFV